MRYPWPPLPVEAGEMRWYWIEEIKTRCKHGRGECERCGTSDSRDVIHKTVNGRGVVARALGGE